MKNNLRYYVRYYVCKAKQQRLNFLHLVKFKTEALACGDARCSIALVDFDRVAGAQPSTLSPPAPPPHSLRLPPRALPSPRRARSASALC